MPAAWPAFQRSGGKDIPAEKNISQSELSSAAPFKPAHL
jgi:hypothetical protein